MTLLPRLALPFILLAALTGCEAISNIQEAAEPLDAYELRSPALQSSAPRADLGNVYVELPSATGALDTDRIAVKPDPLLVQYLPGVRWVNRGTEHFRLLLVRTLADTGRFGFVSGNTSGPTPDYVLLSDLIDFQVEVVPGADGQTENRAAVRARMTLLSDVDRQVIATRTFESTVASPSAEPPVIMVAFDRATEAILREAADWAVAALR